MKDYTAPCGHVFTPAEQYIFYAYCRYYERIQNLETPSNESHEAVVARWLSAPNPNLEPMADYLEAREDLRLEDVVYSLGDFKDFDEWINYVEELEQRNNYDIGKCFQLSSYEEDTLIVIQTSETDADLALRCRTRQRTSNLFHVAR